MTPTTNTHFHVVENTHEPHFKSDKLIYDMPLDTLFTRLIAFFSDISLETTIHAIIFFVVSEFPTKSTECKPQQLIAIGNRLIDWFSVIMADSKKRRQHTQKSKGL